MPATNDEVIAAVRATYKLIRDEQETTRLLISNKFSELNKNLRTMFEQLETRYNMTENSIEAVVGMKEFQEAIKKRLEQAQKEIKPDAEAS